MEIDRIQSLSNLDLLKLVSQLDSVGTETNLKDLRAEWEKRNLAVEEINRLKKELSICQREAHVKMRECPHCAELILAKARICRFCNKSIETFNKKVIAGVAAVLVSTAFATSMIRFENPFITRSAQKQHVDAALITDASLAVNELLRFSIEPRTLGEIRDELPKLIPGLKELKNRTIASALSSKQDTELLDKLAVLLDHAIQFGDALQRHALNAIDAAELSDQAAGNAHRKISLLIDHLKVANQNGASSASMQDVIAYTKANIEKDNVSFLALKKVRENRADEFDKKAAIMLKTIREDVDSVAESMKKTGMDPSVLFSSINDL